VRIRWCYRKSYSTVFLRRSTLVRSFCTALAVLLRCRAVCKEEARVSLRPQLSPTDIVNALVERSVRPPVIRAESTTSIEHNRQAIESTPTPSAGGDTFQIKDSMALSWQSRWATMAIMPLRTAGDSSTPATSLAAHATLRPNVVFRPV
jgi:hypothetical protein